MSIVKSYRVVGFRQRTFRDIDDCCVGMTLIEIMVYLALVSFLCVLLLARVGETIPLYSVMYHRLQLQTIALRLHDTITCDYQDATDVYCFDDSLVCCNGSESCGWELHDTTLFRVVGEYDVKSHSWCKRRKITMAQCVEQCQFETKNGLLHVCLALVDHGHVYELTWDVAPRLGCIW